MITALRAELKKIRGRFIWALPLGVVGMEFLWMMSNSYLAKPEASAEGYFNLLFQLPLLNTIFLPLILAVMASRICDAENKGNTYKLLCTMQEKKKIFDAKLLLGGIYILFLTLLEGANVLLLGRLLHFTQPLPIKHLLPFLAVLFVVSLALYLMQQVLSMLITSQLMPLFIGLLGSLVGVFSAFFPVGSVANFLPWGYYMVGLTLSSWYDESARTMYLYESPFRWGWFSAYLTPGLTTIKQQISLKGERAVNMLVQNMADPNMAKVEEILPVRLVERASVKRIDPDKE